MSAAGGNTDNLILASNSAISATTDRLHVAFSQQVSGGGDCLS